MRTITLPWETWRSVITALREKALPYMVEHADHLEQQLEQHAPEQTRCVWASPMTCPTGASRSRQSPYEFRLGADGIVGGLRVDSIHVVGH
jgi:hypothetical protein